MKENHTNINYSKKHIRPRIKHLILKKKDIGILFAKGRKYRSTSMSLLVREEYTCVNTSLFLFAVSKKIRKKPVRNTLKRRVRMIIVDLYPRITQGYHIGLIVHDEYATFNILKDEISSLLEKANCTIVQ